MTELMDIAQCAAGGPIYGSSLMDMLARSWIKLTIVYCMMLFLCWEEVRYQTLAVEVPGYAEVVGKTVSGRKQNAVLRYRFVDPVSHRQRQNTIHISPSSVPASPEVSVQVISRRESVTSRLTIQAHPVLPKVLLGGHVVLFLYISAVLYYWGREANTRPLTRQQRAVVAYKKRKQKAAKTKGSVHA